MKKYLNKISGPLLDRIDLYIEEKLVSIDELSKFEIESESCEVIREEVSAVRERQDGERV